MLVILAALILAIGAGTAAAAPAPFGLRYSANAPGDITMAANTVLTCPASSACTAAQGGAVNQNNSFGMTFVDVDADATTFDSSRADLSLPPGSAVLFAGLYWGAKNAAGGAPGAAPAPTPGALATVRLVTPGAAAYETITGAIIGTTTESGANYHAFADVTSRVQAAGAGTYTVANVQAGRGTNSWGGWSLVVAYRDPLAPFRNLTVFDGYQVVSTAIPAVTIPVSGFIAPPSGPVRARLGVVAYDGDKGSPGSQFLGDTLRLNGSPVSDVLNPANDFFNSTISRAGVRNAAKLPDFVNQLGFDADLVAVDPLIPNGSTSATIALSTGGETYGPGVVTMAIDLFAPTLQSAKTVTDLNGGEVLPGDLLEYAISLTNTGLDAATGVRLGDPIPAGTAYEPGSLAVSAGAGTGPLTDAAGDDRGEIDPAAGAVFRLGAGATATAGGILAIGETTTVRFRVRVAAGTPAGTVIPNAATTSFAGATTGTPFTDATTPAVVTVGGAPVLSARKTATLDNDADGSGGITAGDVLAYTVQISNSGTQPATGVALADTPDAATRLVVGSVATSVGTVTRGNVAGDTAVGVAVGTLAPGATATIRFRARITATLPVGASQIRNQALVTADGLAPVATDDPLTVVVGDPTVVPVSGAPDPTRLAIDLTGPTAARPGDAVTYCARVTNRGRVTARTVTTRLPVAAGTVLVRVPSGARLSGGAVVWTAASLRAGAQRTVCATLRVRGPAGAVRRPAATAQAVNARRVRDAVRTRLVAPAGRSQPAVTG